MHRAIFDHKNKTRYIEKLSFNISNPSTSLRVLLILTTRRTHLVENNGMALDNYQQTYDLFGKGKNILIIAGHKEIEDTYPAALGLAEVLTNNKKQVAIFSKAEIPENLHFLNNKRTIQKTISGSQDIIVSIDVLQKPIKRIGYKRSNAHLNIYITPEKDTRIEEGDVHIKLGKFHYDLIITVGVEDLASLKEEFERNASLFFETPIVNIDKSSSNERYGEINIVELTSSSCSEIITNLLKEWGEELITKKIATSLLAGIIVSTNNFQNARTKPKTLFASAHLMSCEGEQQEIIKNVFKTKSFEFLKLWGIAMSKLQFQDDKKISWLTLTQNDFKESDTTPKALRLIVTELKNNFSQADTFVVFWENHTSYFGLVHTLYEEQLGTISKFIEGERRGNNLLFNLPSKDAGDREKILTDVSRALDEYKIQ